MAALPQGVVDGVLLGDLVNVWDDTGCTSEFDNILCYLVDLEYVGMAGTANFPGVGNLGALSDLVPGSAFLNNLNGQTESFNRAAVIGNTDRRWIEVRVADEFIAKGCNPEDSCGERNVAAIYGIVYDIVQITWDIAEFDCLLQGDPYACDVADYTLPIWVDMDVADLDYNILAADGAPEDGIVPSSSQEYPSPSALQYPINHADSHMGATRSDRARNALYEALVNPPFSVPTQASCSFSASPGSYSVAAGGGGSTFTVNTGAGCAWSSTSTAPWITITAGSSGNSSSNVSFSVAANTSTLPRSGTITVGSDASSAGFSIQQAGVCYYALSVNTVSIPSGGGSATATVWTSTGCQWSAVPNEPWITITNGGGTGNGSFTVSTGANSQDSDLIGTVTIMGQTLTVILGNPVGTPGTGHVTINGTPQSKYICRPGCHSPCDKSCAELIYNSGSITITIAGDSYYETYSSNESASQFAAALANAINGGSIASASGSTIYITAKTNGSLTNYSLSTSYSYDTTDFSSAAFTPSASGPSLTGGTD